MKLFGMPVIVDDSLPEGEIRLTDWRSYIQIVNIGERAMSQSPKVSEYPDDEPCADVVSVKDVIFLKAQGVYVCRRCRWRVADIGAKDAVMRYFIHTAPEPTDDGAMYS